MSIYDEHMLNFITESNRIEGIHRKPTEFEIEEYKRFMNLKQVTIADLEQFVSVYQPGNRLRDMVGLDVRVGNYYPPKGKPEIRNELQAILDDLGVLTSYQTHCRYETLHPFTDCNGRSGRMLWLWQMKYAPLGFLHTWYYQSLDALQSRK